MNRKGYIVIGAVLLLAASAYVGSAVLRGRDAPSSTVETALVARRDIGSTVSATGIIKPMVGAEVRVGSRISGVVKRLRAQIGDRVEAGQLIAELDDAELQARISLNTAALAKAKADLDYATLVRDREAALLTQRFTSPQQAEQAEAAFLSAAAQHRQADANLEYARVQLSYTNIVSPISGVIASVSTQEGETVSASLAAPTFVSVIDLRRLEVQVFVDETDIGKIRVGQRAEFTVDTYADADFQGTVTAIYPKAVIQDNVVNYVVTAQITDSQGKILRPEMTTSVSIQLETRRRVLAVPTSSITRERAERYVTVIEGEKRTQRKVKVGWKDSGFTEIISGLQEGERVLAASANQVTKP